MNKNIGVKNAHKGDVITNILLSLRAELIVFLVLNK